MNIVVIGKAQEREGNRALKFFIEADNFEHLKQLGDLLHEKYPEAHIIGIPQIFAFDSKESLDVHQRLVETGNDPDIAFVFNAQGIGIGSATHGAHCNDISEIIDLDLSRFMLLIDDSCYA